MVDQQTATPVTDTRFLDVLRLVCGSVVDATGEGRNGEVFMAYRRQVGVFELPASIPYRTWLGEQVDAALRSEIGPLQAMLAARTRLGENVRLVQDIDLERLRASLDDSDKSDGIDALLDFVAEVRNIAKEI